MPRMRIARTKSGGIYIGALKNKNNTVDYDFDIFLHSLTGVW